MKTHELKIWPQFYSAILDSSKTFEARKDDRGFKVGDRLRLREYDPATGKYTSRELCVYVTHILRDPEFGVKNGWCIMSIRSDLAL
jgi:hypothetical protein